MRDQSPDALLDEFRDRTGALGVRVDLAAEADLGRAVLAISDAWGIERIVAAPRVADRFPGLLSTIEPTGRTVAVSTGADLARDAPLGVSLGSIAIAETGSVLLDERSLADRAVSMLALAQIVICPARGLVLGLDDAAPVLREIAARSGGGYATLVTGPSRTADIERALTVGVQGPARVAIILVAENQDSDPGSAWEEPGNDSRR